MGTVRAGTGNEGKWNDESKMTYNSAKDPRGHQYRCRGLEDGR